MDHDLELIIPNPGNIWKFDFKKITKLIPDLEYLELNNSRWQHWSLTLVTLILPDYDYDDVASTRFYT